MKDYMLLLRGSHVEAGTQSPEEMQAHMGRWGEWMGKLAEAGKLISGQPLATQVGTVIAGKSLALTDGPYAEGKELVGGWIALKAESLEAAIAEAKSCPALEFDGTVEVREILPMD